MYAFTLFLRILFLGFALPSLSNEQTCPTQIFPIMIGGAIGDTYFVDLKEDKENNYYVAGLTNDDQYMQVAPDLSDYYPFVIKIGIANVQHWNHILKDDPLSGLAYFFGICSVSDLETPFLGQINYEQQIVLGIALQNSISVDDFDIFTELDNEKTSIILSMNVVDQLEASYQIGWVQINQGIVNLQTTNLNLQISIPIFFIGLKILSLNEAQVLITDGKMLFFIFITKESRTITENQIFPGLSSKNSISKAFYSSRLGFIAIGGFISLYNCDEMNQDLRINNQVGILYPFNETYRAAGNDQLILLTNQLLGFQNATLDISQVNIEAQDLTDSFKYFTTVK
ncbi:UNKNOWN [Stylonychia lemnae]|uniref:Uncharacterized protein n=1 Tax=Stylonychia lemnae TaxID=5949 RepID=A0A078B6L2_STYLE|nr:UNKNOWN [Stylonychia lemnae]|eukprot:CDW89861.1 UNKNOWN [Stylonychia lemnae]